MSVPFICGGAALTMLEPTFPRLTGPVVLALILLAAAVAASSLVAPVAAPLVRSEVTSRAGASRAFAVLSVLSSALLIVGLGLLQFPIGCATHAMLVSAAVAPSTELDEAEFGANVRAEAQVSHRLVRDLAPLRDRVLERLLPHAETAIAPEEIARDLREELSRASRYGFPEPQLNVRRRARERMDPSVIESVEVGLLMGWRALYSGDDQHLTFAVSSRAEAYNWQWKNFANLPIFHSKVGPVLTVRRVGAGTATTPLLTRVIRSSVTESRDRLSVDGLITTNGATGDISLALLGFGADTVRTVLSIPPDVGPTFLGSATFVGRNDFDRATAIQQIGVDGSIVVTRAFPPRQLDVVRLDLRMSALRPTFDYLAGRTDASCGADSDVAAQLAGWRKTFARTEDYAPLLGGESGSNVTLRMELGGVVLVLPTRSGPWPAGPLSNADLTRLGMAANPVAPFRHPVERAVAWTATDMPQRDDLDRLGVDGKALPGELALNPDRTSIVKMAAASHDEIASRRLTRDDPASLYFPALARVSLPDQADSSLQHQASIVLGDPKALGVLCGFPIPEAEVFFAYWRRILEAITVAAGSTVTLSAVETTPSLAGPTIYLKQPALDQIASARLEWPLLMVAIATAIFVVFVVIAYVRAVLDLRSR